MKWFKHDANASIDAKLQRLRLKYGMEGYGLYWFCLEAIARNVETHNLTFELEEDSELIAASTGIHHERVQEMMAFMVNLKLFENAEGRITCLKMASRADEYTQKLLRKTDALPTLSGHSPDTVTTKSRQTPDKVPPIRIEQNRTDTNARFDAFWSVYPKKVDKKKALSKFAKLKPADQQTAIDNATERAKSDDQWLRGFAPNPTTYLNGERWNDEWQKSTGTSGPQNPGNDFYV